MLADRQTNAQTDVLITILRLRSCGRSNKQHKQGNRSSHFAQTPKIAPFPRDFVTPQEDRATATRNMSRNLAKIARVAPEICSRTDRQTNPHTDTQTYVLITILHQRCRGRSNQQHKRVRSMQYTMSYCYILRES